MQILLSLDLATKTGYCISSSSGVLVSGVLNYTIKPLTKKQKASGMKRDVDSKFFKFKKDVTELLTKYNVTTCSYEDVQFITQGSKQASSYFGLRGVLLSILYKREVPIIPVSVGALKKHCTGKGNANKADMVTAVESKIGREVKDDNEADAIALSYYAWDIIKRGY